MSNGQFLPEGLERRQTFVLDEHGDRSVEQRGVGVGQLIEIRVDEEVIHIDLKDLLVLLDVITKKSSVGQFVDLFVFEKGASAERRDSQRRVKAFSIWTECVCRRCRRRN